MLSEHEQKIWDEIVRDYQAEADEPARGGFRNRTGGRRSGARADLPAVVIGGGWSAVFLLLFGVPSAGLAVGAATGLIWLLWRFFPQLNGAGAADAERITENVDDRTGAADQQLAVPWHRPRAAGGGVTDRTGRRAAQRPRRWWTGPLLRSELTADLRQGGSSPSR